MIFSHLGHFLRASKDFGIISGLNEPKNDKKIIITYNPKVKEVKIEITHTNQAKMS